MDIEQITKEAERIYEKNFRDEKFSSSKQPFICGFSEGVEFANRQLSEWKKPDDPPGVFVEVLLKVLHKDVVCPYITHELGFYRGGQHIYPGKTHYYEYHGMKPSDDVIGWKPII